MNEKQSSYYDKKISEKIITLMDYLGLEIKGIAALTGKSTHTFYSIISCRRKLTQDIAEAIGKAVGFDGNSIFNINSPIDPQIRNSSAVQKFRRDNANNKEYFTVSWSEDKDSVFIRKNLIYSGYFNQQRYAWEVNEKLAELGRKVNSDLLSKHLRYFVKKEILKSEKRAIKLKNGEFGKRMVEVYFL